MKYLKILLSIVALTVVSCNNEEKLKKQYIEACSEGNFDKARGIVTKLEAMNPDEARSAIQYVNDKEIYNLLSKTSRENDQRIVYLYNTYESDQLPNMTDVLEVAISTDRDYLAEKLLKSGVNPDRSSIAAAVAAENEELVDMMLKMIANSVEDKIKELYRVKIPTCPAVGRVRSNHYGEIPDEYENYKNAVEYFNNECLSILNEAIDYNLPEVANKAVSLMKPNLEWNNLGDWEDVVTHSGNSSVFNAFDVKQTRTEIEEAKKLLQNN